MMAPELRLVDAALSDTGKVRAANEDAFVAMPALGLWAVADGMGGHANGQWASRVVVDALGRVAISGDFDADALRVGEAIRDANSRIHDEVVALGAKMGSTAATLLVRGGRFAVLWVGDSRVYLWRAGDLHQLTRDHTQVQELVDRGLLSPEDAAHHPMSHVISRAVGVQAVLEVEAVSDDVIAGDVFLLCSDGLTGLVSDAEIAQVLSQVRPRLACERLIDVCLRRGAPDNVTVIAIACDPATLVLSKPPPP
jgi:serine/threonine-protein phosphatase Stp1